jgi:hypothetical protein
MQASTDVRNAGRRRAPRGIVGNAEMRSASIVGTIRRSGRDPLHDPAELRGLVVGDSVESDACNAVPGLRFKLSLSSLQPPREWLWRSSCLPPDSGREVVKHRDVSEPGPLVFANFIGGNTHFPVWTRDWKAVGELRLDSVVTGLA